MAIRLVLAADEPGLVRAALRALLEREGFEIAGEGRVGTEAARLVADLEPDVTVLDLVGPDGLGAVRSMAEAAGTRLLLLSMQTGERYVMDAFAAGIRGYFVKMQSAA